MYDYRQEKKKARGLQQVVLDVLRQHVGHQNAIKARDLAHRVGERGDRRVRIAVAQLRKRGYLILSSVGSPPGYFFAATQQEWLQFRHGNLRARALDILETDRAMAEAAQVEFGRQMPLDLRLDTVA